MVQTACFIGEQSTELEEYFLYDNEHNQDENKCLAAVDLEAVNVTNKVSVKKANKSTEVNRDL